MPANTLITMLGMPNSLLGRRNSDLGDWRGEDEDLGAVDWWGGGGPDCFATLAVTKVERLDEGPGGSAPWRVEGGALALLAGA